HDRDDVAHVALPERIDPDVAAEGLGGILAEVAAVASGGLVELSEEVGQELGSVLDGRDAQPRKSLEEAVECECDQEVVRGALDVEDLDRGPTADLARRSEERRVRTE